MIRVVRLTERVPRVVRLRRADADYLLALHRHYVEVVPTAERGRYRLTARGVAGVLPCPSVRLVIRPKLPPGELLRLLDPFAPDDASTPAAGDALLDALARRFAAYLRELIVVGLHRTYVECRTVGPTLVGRLDFPAQAVSFRRDVLHGRHDDLTADVPVNRFLRAVVERTLSYPELGSAARAELAAVLPAFADASPEIADIDDEPAGYAAALGLARLLAEGLAPGADAGGVAGPAFLIDLERAFERGIAVGLAAAFADRPGVRVRAQPWLNAAAAGSALHLRPDVLLERDGRPFAVVDAKWKRLPPTALVTDDAYQVLAYAAALGVPRVALVYPGGLSKRRRYELTGGVALEVWAVRPGAPLGHLARALQ